MWICTSGAGAQEKGRGKVTGCGGAEPGRCHGDWPLWQPRTSASSPSCGDPSPTQAGKMTYYKLQNGDVRRLQVCSWAG